MNEAANIDPCRHLSPRQAAEVTGLGYAEICRAMSAGELPFKFKGSTRKHRVIVYAHLLEWSKRDVRTEMVEAVLQDRPTIGGRGRKLTLMVGT